MMVSRIARPGNAPGGLVRAHMATFPPRAGIFRRVVEAVLPQVDRLAIVFNEYDEVPADIAADDRIEAVVPDSDVKDVGKFFSPVESDDIVFLVDDDIGYPADYVARSIERATEIGWDGNVFGYLGLSFGGEAGQKSDWRIHRFTDALAEARGVRLLGTGTVVARGDALPSVSDMTPYRGHADVGFGLFSLRAGRRAWALPRENRWLKENLPKELKPSSLFRTERLRQSPAVVRAVREVIAADLSHLDLTPEEAGRPGAAAPPLASRAQLKPDIAKSDRLGAVYQEAACSGDDHLTTSSVRPVKDVGQQAAVVPHSSVALAENVLSRAGSDEAVAAAVADKPSKRDFPLTLPPDEAAALAAATAGAGVFLEYGSGGSTFLALESGVDLLMSVESDKDWAEGVRASLAPRFPAERFLIHHADIGPTKAWGRPANPSGFRRYHLYSTGIWDHPRFRHPDVVLIDGRFRVACFLATMIRCTRPVTVLFDDYIDRKHYHWIEEMIPRDGMIGRMARFTVTPKPLPPEQLTRFADAFTDPR